MTLTYLSASRAGKKSAPADDSACCTHNQCYFSGSQKVTNWVQTTELCVSFCMCVCVPVWAAELTLCGWEYALKQLLQLVQQGCFDVPKANKNSKHQANKNSKHHVNSCMHTMSLLWSPQWLSWQLPLVSESCDWYQQGVATRRDMACCYSDPGGERAKSVFFLWITCIITCIQYKLLYTSHKHNTTLASFHKHTGQCNWSQCNTQKLVFTTVSMFGSCTYRH